MAFSYTFPMEKQGLFDTFPTHSSPSAPFDLAVIQPQLEGLSKDIVAEKLQFQDRAFLDKTLQSKGEPNEQMLCILQ